MHSLASPARFIRLSDTLLPWLSVLTVLLLLFGVTEALVVSPADYQQGDTVRIMYVHVPSAWMSMMIYSVMAAASASFLIWKHTLADVVARVSAPIGAGFTAVTLVTGSLWGKPMWGTWWVWDARLTSVLILFLFYIGYIALWEAFDDPEKGGRACAILALVGAVNLPIVKFSVDWWSSLHQPASVMTLEGTKIAASILWPLLLMGIGFTAYYIALLCVRARTEILRRRVRIRRLANFAVE